jgi:pimeloyl-ACP methyl ester carboxylesterase
MALDRRYVVTMKMRREPFARIPFDQLPERPRLAHPYFDAESVDLAMDTPSFGKTRIHYKTYGSGPPLLLIHGLMTTSYSWRYVLEDLGRRFRVIAPDLPGCGRSDKPLDRSYHPAALAEWIGDFQDAVGITGCGAVGNSLGGHLCLRRVLSAPTSFARLAVIHAPVLPDRRLRALHAALAVPGAARVFARWIRSSPHTWAHRHVHYYDETLKSLEEAREYGEPLSTADGAQAFVRWASETLAPAELGRFAAGLRRRLRDDVAFPVPLLLLYAKQDPLVDPAMGDALRAMVPSATLIRLENSSHFAHVDTPTAVAEAIASFFAENGKSRAHEPGGGSHSSKRLPSGSVAQPNRP